MLNKKYKDVVLDLNVAITNDTTNTDYYLLRGVANANSGNIFVAMEDYKTAIKRDPGNAKAYLNRGFTKMTLNDNQGACEDFYEARSLGHSAASKQIKNYCE